MPGFPKSGKSFFWTAFAAVCSTRLMKKEIIIETETVDEKSAIAKGGVYVGFEMGFKHAVELLNYLAYEEKSLISSSFLP